MKMTFRWYGDDDPVTLEEIRQIPGVTGVVTAVYTVPAGEIWPEEEIDRLKREINEQGLEMEVIESVPVHEDIKLRQGRYAEYTENYKENIRRLAKAGVKCICYNFMPVFDWTRSRLDQPLADGSRALVYYKEDVDRMDPAKMALPGWDASYSSGEIGGLIEKYKELGEEGLWRNLELFLKEIIPVSEECGVKMAIHPDDPPWNIFGLPRIIKNKKNIERFLKLYDSPNNGLTLCSGSLGADGDNDIIDMIHSFGNRIHFAHIRNIKRTGEHSFEETSHRTADGSLDIFGIVKAYHDEGFSGYVRPDHGRMIWGEKGRPGYGLYDRALGAAYLNGLFEACERLEEKK